MAKRKSRKNDRKIVEEMLRRHEESGKLWKNLHEDWKKHYRFVFGEKGQWTADELARMGEPALQTNLLMAYVLQIANKFIRQDIGCDVEPISSGASMKLARVRQAQVMTAWRKWGGQFALGKAMKDLVGGGYAVMYQTIDWADNSTFDKKLCFKAMRDPTKFRCDPSAEEAAMSDMDYAIIDEQISEGTFRKRYGEWRDVADEDREKWEKGDRKMVYEYWRRSKKPGSEHEIVLLSNAATMPMQEYLEQQFILNEQGIFAVQNADGEPVTREVCDYIVEQFIITNERIVHSEVWPLDRLPFKVFTGREVIDSDGKRRFLSMASNAEGPQRKYNFIESQKAILYGKGPIDIVFVPSDGDTTGLEDKIREAQRNGSRDIIVVPYKALDANGNQLPMPSFKTPRMGDPVLTEEALLTKKDIEQCFGMVNPGFLERPRGTSGVAIERTEQQGDNSSFDIIESALIGLQELFIDTMKLLGSLGINMQVKLAGDDQKQEVVWVGDPSRKPSDISETVPYDDEEYSLVISARPSPETIREKSFEQMTEFAKRHPHLAPAIADLDARSSLSSLYADDIAERAHRFVATNYPSLLNENEDPRTAAVRMQLEQAQQIIASMTQRMEDLQRQSRAKEEELRLQIAGLRADKENETERLRLEAAVKAEESKQEWAKLQIQGLQLQEKSIRQVVNPEIESIQGGGV